MATQDTPRGTPATLEAFQDQIVAQMQEAEARIQQLEVKVREKRLQVEIAAVNGLKAARLNIERKLKELATTQEAQIARAKADIDGAAEAFKTSLDEFGRKLSTLSDDVTRTERSS
jgi:chromosome segregation ATPase